jgi:AraC-like DNA-binding protein
VNVYDGCVDILSDELSRARARGAVFSVLRRAEPWGLRFEGARPLTVHILLSGAGRLDRDGLEPLTIRAGDVVLATAGVPYSIVSELGAPTVPIAAARQEADQEADGARVMCGAYTLTGSVGKSLLSSLPLCAVIRAEEQDAAHAGAIQLLAAEAVKAAEGQQALLDRLLDVNLVYTLRAWWRTTGTAPGWYRALGHPPIRHVLELLHAHPEREWTLVTMAGQAGMSRAAFAARFRELVGLPPGQYLTRLRMSRAEDALARTDATVAKIAAGAGYGNEFAFATAFRRQHGVSPGRWRTRNRAAGEPAVSFLSGKS